MIEADPSTADRMGLDDEEAARRLAEFGRNELPMLERRSLWRITASVLTEPMFLLLALAAASYLVLGDAAEGALLAFFATLTIGLVVAQEEGRQGSVRNAAT